MRAAEDALGPAVEIGPAPAWTLAPLAAWPLVANLRLGGLPAPNDDPKVLVLLLVLVAAVSLWVVRPSLGRQIDLADGAGALLLSWFALGALVGPNRTDGIVRLGLWGAAAVVAVAARRGAMCDSWRVWMHRCSVTAATLCTLGFWIGYPRFLRPGGEIWVGFSPVGHVSFTADLLAPWLPLLWWTACERRERFALRALGAVNAISFTAVLLVAGSRAGLLGLLLSSAVLGGLLLWGSRAAAGATSRPRGTVVAGAVAATIALGVLVYVLLPVGFRGVTRLGTALKPRPADAFVPGPGTDGRRVPLDALFRSQWLGARLGPRLPMYAASVSMVAERPLLGHGTGSFRSVYPTFARRHPGLEDPLVERGRFATNPHNAWLQIAAENGVLAASVLAILGVLAMLRGAVRWRRTGETQPLFALAALAAMAPGLVLAHTLHSPASLFLAALVAGLLAEGRGVRRPANATHRWLGGALLLVLLALAPAILGWAVARWHLASARALPPRTSAQLRAFESAVWFNADCDPALASLAVDALAGGDTDRARRFARRAVTVNPGSAVGWRVLAEAEVLLGDRAKAREALERLLLIVPDDRAAAQALAGLRAGSGVGEGDSCIVSSIPE